MTALDKNQVDPALWPLVEGFPSIDVTAATLAGFREALIGMFGDARCREPRRRRHRAGVGSRRRRSDARQSAACCTSQTQRAVTSALLHIHSGGFVMGTVEMDAARNIELVRGIGCAILSVDYRLAPEHPHPAALEDCHAALVWFASQAKALGVSPDRIGVVGESAGGGLAASLTLLARDRSSVPLACQALVYPMLVPPAQSVDTALPDPRTGHYIWTRTSNDFAWSAYLSGGAPDPATIAGLASNLSRLPPAFLAVGDIDLFVHDDLAYVSRLMRGGCAVEAHLFPGAIHGFDRAVEAPVSQRFMRKLVAFLNRHLAH